MIYKDAISISEFARIVGRSKTQMYRLIDEGKLTVDENRKMSPTVNLKEWKKLRNIDDSASKESVKQIISESSLSSNSKADIEELLLLAEQDPFQALNKARALETIYKVEERQLSIDKEKGKLVEIETVQTTFKDIAVKVRQEILAIPQRYAGRLEGRNEREIETMLEEALSEAMTKLQLDVK